MSDDIPLTEQQRDDLVRILVRYVPIGNLKALVENVMGANASDQFANDMQDLEVFAREVVKALHQGGHVAAAVAHLRQGMRYGKLQLCLQRVLNGVVFGSDDALQAFINPYEPLLSSKDLIEVYPQVVGRVCAVGLGHPFNRIAGSGFLIAPDLVMTNFHVLQDLLVYEHVTKTITPSGIGGEIYFFFDYLSGPPPVVPPNGASANSFSVSAAKDWLVHARKLLPGDGTTLCPAVVDTEYDYAVIRLAERIGERPLRRSGGQIRGWLELRDGIDVDTADQRVLVFQHPGTGPQQWDVGEFVKLDRTKTRVWYRVNAAHGSSGGAAVDKAGQLFALHNAEVKEDVYKEIGTQVNQGVRIDYIYRDLLNVPGYVGGQSPVSAIDTFWSLKDDPGDPKPVIGRMDFRKHVSSMQAGAENIPRVLSVTGPPGSGKRFSVELLRRIIGEIPVVEFSEKELQVHSPEVFLQVLVQELGLSSTPSMPAPQSTEAFSSWLRLDLPKWLLARLAESQQSNPTTFPRWIVMNTVTADSHLLWAHHLRDFVVALLGIGDRGQPGIQLKQLRWLFLRETADGLLLNKVPRYEEDLTSIESDVSDFATCVQLACDALDKPLLDSEGGLKYLAGTMLEARAGEPRRKVLADHVCHYLKNRYK